MLNGIGHSVSNLANSNYKDDVEAAKDDDDTQLGPLREVDEPSWVMVTISMMVQHRMERFR